MINAIYVCTLHGVTYHVPCVVITSRGAFSCKAATDLGETKLVFSMRVHERSQDAFTIHLLTAHTFCTFTSHSIHVLPVG